MLTYEEIPQPSDHSSIRFCSLPLLSCCNSPVVARARLISGETIESYKPPNMRLLPITLLYALYATGIVSAGAKTSNTDEVASDELKPTVFNGVEVPPLPDLDGETFNETVKDGYWFVKHHSSVFTN